ncbi:conserved Plasmodium protein, unknown function [Plasmodium sp. gorilla clade G2]|uniref:conserved Plasmodium protein, unknown function n=1 Tax=Plasmodium sp. gorilla clade G2 TaxID=880535 RepID=UPI000D21DC9D|nr:conserved Plasmodium protein, unknown function [Plasmodium sp. gorilla clade G2]SOV16580.1 conserved Plasmodium protein, unknown function [Plasmodium sp. gorilla clade G2]
MKGSLKRIKEKLKSTKKKGYYVTFYDRIKQINEKEKLEDYNSIHDNNYEDYLKSINKNDNLNNTEELKRTNFHRALNEYPKDCYNKDFRRCCNELSIYSKNLMVILLNKDKIFNIIFKYIEHSKVQNDEQYFYKLLVILIKDLKDESRKYLEATLKILYNKISLNNLDLLEEIFNSYANIFRLMNKTIIKNIDKYLKLALPLLSHRNNIIKLFIADSFSYLLKKLSLHDLILCFNKIFSFFNYIPKSKLNHYSETVSLLLLEALKVDNKNISKKKTLPFLKYLICSIFLRQSYYCNETEAFYDYINIDAMNFVQKCISNFFRDFYNFIKDDETSYEFIELFLTFLLKHYSLLYDKYYNKVITIGVNNNMDNIDNMDNMDNMDNIDNINKDRDNLLNFDSVQSQLIYHEIYTKCYKCQNIYNELKDNVSVHTFQKNNLIDYKENIMMTHSFFEKLKRHYNIIHSNNTNQKNENEENILTNNISEIGVFINYTFPETTSFLLKKILYIWIEKSEEMKNIIIQTCLDELTKYIDYIKDIPLNEISFIYVKNIYDHVFFLLNYHCIINEDICNIYISLIEKFMNIINIQSKRRKNIFNLYLLSFLIFHIYELLNKKHMIHSQVHFKSFLKCVFINLWKYFHQMNIIDFYQNNVYIINGINKMKKNNNLHKNVDNILQQDNKIKINQINHNNNSNNYNDNIEQTKCKSNICCNDFSFLLNNLYIGILYILTDILKYVISLNQNDDTINIEINDKDNKTLKKKNSQNNNIYQTQSNNNIIINNNNNNNNNNYGDIYSFNKYKIYNKNYIHHNNSKNNPFFKEIEKELEKMLIYIFNNIKHLNIILNDISECDKNISTIEQNENKRIQIKYTIILLSAYINLFSEIISTNNLCIYDHFNDVETISPLFYNICEILQKFKSNNYFLNTCKDKNQLLDMNIYVNNIILDITNIIIILSKECRHISENILLTYNMFVLNCLNDWNKSDICNVHYLPKMKSIILNLYNVNYFKNNINDIFLFLKIFKKFLLFYDTILITRKELIQIVKILMSIYVELKLDKYKIQDNKDDSNNNIYVIINGYDKIFSIFDMFLSLECDKYLTTYQNIYHSKIEDIVNNLDHFKIYNIFNDNDRIFKVATKFFVSEIIMLLNVPLVTVPKAIVDHMKKYLRTYSNNQDINPNRDDFSFDFYFYIVNCIFKNSRKKIEMIEYNIKLKNMEKYNLINNSEYINKSEDIIAEQTNEDIYPSVCDDKNGDNNNMSDHNISRDFNYMSDDNISPDFNYMSDHNISPDNNNINNYEYLHKIDDNISSHSIHENFKKLIYSNIKDEQENIQNYLNIKEQKMFILLEENYNELFLKNILTSFDIIAVPYPNNLPNNLKLKMLNIYLWIMRFLNINCSYYINEFKYFPLLNLLFDITLNINDQFHKYGDKDKIGLSLSEHQSDNNLKNENNINMNQHIDETNERKSLIYEILFCIKIFISKYLYNLHILKVPNIVKFLNILCTYNKKLNNYKNDIEEILRDQNIPITKLLLNIKKEDENIVTPILIKIIFCLLKSNIKKKGQYKMRKNMIFYLSDISNNNYCYLFLSVIYSYINVYENKMNYNNLLKYSNKELVLINFLNSTQEDLNNLWYYEFNVQNIDKIINKNGNIFSYEDMFKSSYWVFQNYIIEIKKEALFETFYFNKNFNILGQILNVMKFKLNKYFPFFLQIFLTIMHYINSYNYILKNKKVKNLFMKMCHMVHYGNNGVMAAFDEYLNLHEKQLNNIKSKSLINDNGDNMNGGYVDNPNNYEDNIYFDNSNNMYNLNYVQATNDSIICTNEKAIQINTKRAYLKNIHKTCIEHIHFIMNNYDDIILPTLIKSKNLFTFIFYKNLKNIGRKNNFLNILFHIWSKNEAYYDLYNSVIPNSLLILIKAINNKRIINKLNNKEWTYAVDKVYDIILRLCGYDTDTFFTSNVSREYKNAKKKKKNDNNSNINNIINEHYLLLDNKISTTLKKINNYNFHYNSKGMIILKPYISHIIVCIQKTLLRKYKLYVIQNGNMFKSIRKNKNIDELTIINNKELHILIELSAINKNKIYNIHIINLLITFVLINKNSLHTKNIDYIHKIKLILIAIKKLIINISNTSSEEWAKNHIRSRKNTKKKKTNLSFNNIKNIRNVDNLKMHTQIKNNINHKNVLNSSHVTNDENTINKKKKDKIFSSTLQYFSESYYNMLKTNMCYKLKSMLYEIIQRCYDMKCRILTAELLIMIGCIFLQIKNVQKYLQIFKKNVDTFLEKTNNLNYNSKIVLKHIIKIPIRTQLKNKNISTNNYYSFLQTAQIFYGLNIFHTKCSTYEYDSDVQFLILLDLCNIKISYKLLKEYMLNGQSKKYINYQLNEEITLSSKQNDNIIYTQKDLKKFTAKHLFFNSNLLFFEVLLRHSLFLIFNEETNDMVRDKSIQFTIFFTKLLKCLLTGYEIDNKNTNLNTIDNNIVRNIKICIHFVINIIIPKCLNALKRNINEFTKISLQIILIASKNICPYINVLKLLNIEQFIKHVKMIFAKNHISFLSPSKNNIITSNSYANYFNNNKINDENNNEPYFKILEKLLFYDLYYNICNTTSSISNSIQYINNNNITKNKNNQMVYVNSKNKYNDIIVENIIDLKSENNLQGVQKLNIITPNLCFYTINKIIIPLSLNFILQKDTKKETYNKALSLQSMKLLGLCSEKIGVKTIYFILRLLLSEMKKNLHNKMYVEKTISHVVRAYHFKEFQKLQYEHISTKWNSNSKGEDKIRQNDKSVHSNMVDPSFNNNMNQTLTNDNITKNLSLKDNKKNNINGINNNNDGDGNGHGDGDDHDYFNNLDQTISNTYYEKKKSNIHTNKFICDILPELKYLMFDKKLINDKKKQKRYINNLVVDYKSKDSVAKPDIILTYLVILNKINYNFEKELRKIIYKLCYCLSSKLNMVRSEAKKTLCYISMYLGLNYFDLIIKQMSDYLTKGYHIPIFLCTTNSILESVLYEKDKFLDKNYLTIKFNVLNERNFKRTKVKNNDLTLNNKEEGIIKDQINKNDSKRENDKTNDNSYYTEFCANIFNMIKLEIINEIEKNTEDVNKKRIKQKTKESKKTYGSNIIRLLTNIVTESCIENNILTFLESLFSGDSFQDNEVDKYFIFKKKYIFIVTCYFNDFIKGLEENKKINSKFILNIIYKLLIKSIYFFKGDINYENLMAVMKDSNILHFKFNQINDKIINYPIFKKSFHFYVTIQTVKEKYLGYNYENKTIQYPKKRNNLEIMEGSFQGKNIYDSIQKSNKYDFQVHAQILARVSLKLFLFIIKRSSQIFSDTTNVLDTNGSNNNNINDNKINGFINNTDDYIKRKDKDSYNNIYNVSTFVQFIHIVEPLLVYCFCYGKEEVFILASKCIKIIKKKKYCDFKKFGKLIILSSIDILKNLPNYHSREFDKLIVSCIDTLIYLIKGNDKNDIMSWLNSNVSLDHSYNNTTNKDISDDENPRKKSKGEKNEKYNNKTNGIFNKEEEDKHQKVQQRNKKLCYLLDESVLSSHNYNGDNDYNSTTDEQEECMNSLRYCLLNQIHLLLESKNHIFELLILFKNCLLREDVNNILKKGPVILKINMCIEQIFNIMVEESHNLKLSFLCGQIYIDFFMRFPLSQKEKKKKFFNILNNLNDENDESRIAVLNTIYLFLNRANSKLLKQEFYFITFASLLINFSNETNYKCRKMYVFLISLLFQQINDLDFIYNSYKIIKQNLLSGMKSSFVYSYLYVLPICTSFFHKDISNYYRLLFNDISQQFEYHKKIYTKEYRRTKKEEIMNLCLQAKGEITNGSIYNGINNNNNNNMFDENKVDTQFEHKILNHFINQLLTFINKKEEGKNINICSNYIEEQIKKKQNCNKINIYNNDIEHMNNNCIIQGENNISLNITQYYNITFMKNQLEDLFLSIIFHLIDKIFINIKLIVKDYDDIIKYVFTSIENITYFCNRYDIYKQVDNDIVYLFYKSLEQIIAFLDINLIENIIHEKYSHENYKDIFIKMIELKNRNNKNNYNDNILLSYHDNNYEKLIMYFLYFWNLIFTHGLMNKNPYIQIISMKIIINYISKKLTNPFFPLLLIKLYTTDKFIINIIIKKILSLLLNYTFLEYFYIYYKEVSSLLCNICNLLISFPWITNGYNSEDNKYDINHVKNYDYMKNLETLNNSLKLNNNDINIYNNNNMDNISTNEENKNIYITKNVHNNISDEEDVYNNSSEEQEFNKVNNILKENDEDEYKNNHSIYKDKTIDYQNNKDKLYVNQNIVINKEILSYSKFFLIIITLSRAINLHLKNKKKSFTRIYTILNTYKQIIQDFPVNLWNREYGIINNVLIPLYKIASIFKKKDFVLNENIFHETDTYKKFLYLSSFSWYIISLLEKKLEHNQDVFNKAFIQTRQSINRIRFLRKKKKKLMAVTNPKVFILNKMKRRKKKQLQKKQRKIML